MQTALIFIENDFQDAEALYPYYRLKEAGFDVMLVGPEKKEYFGKHGYPLQADSSVADAKIKDQTFDVIVIPGGWAPDRLRRNKDVLELVRRHCQAKKTVAAICHGPSVLASAGVLKGRTLTSFDAIKDDVTNAGGTYVDRDVVVDGNLVTSRKPEDLPAFCREILRVLSR